MNRLKILTITALLTTFSMAQKEALILGVSDYMGTKYDLGGVKMYHAWRGFLNVGGFM